MSTTGKPPSQQLLELQKLFHQQLPEKISDISIVWRLLSDQDNLRLSDVSEWHRKVHSLAGSGSTFGAFSVSKAALELEVVIEALVEIGENSALVFSDSVKTQISILVTELEKSARKWQPSNIPFIPQITTDHKGENAGKNLVYLVEDDTLLAAEITEHLVAADYDVKHFEGIADFEQACDQNIPAAVIMDMVLSEGNSAGAEAITRMKAKYEVAPPVVIISVRTDIHSRLAAARAGALRYFSKPVDMDSLIQTINGLTARVAKKPYRVLIIDDDPILLEYYSAILKGAGFLVKSLDNPLEGLETLETFLPDLVLSDVYMPGCSGPELAQVIRQNDFFALIPIVFLSTESNLDRKLAAMNLGGDEFLTKPITPKHLVESITARAKRARWTNRITHDLKNALRESNYLRITMDQHDIVTIVDVNGVISSVNDKFCHISAYDRKELIGKTYRMLQSPNYSPENDREMWETLRQGKVWHGVVCNRNKNGRDYWVDTTIVPFLDEKGTPYQYVSASTDISALRSNEDRLKQAQRLGHIGNWSSDILNNEIYWSDALYQILGHQPGAFKPNNNQYFNHVHPDEIDIIKNLMNQVSEKTKTMNIDHRIIRADGKVRWVHLEVEPVANIHGRTVHLLGVVQDISDRKYAELLQQGNNQILEMIARATPLNDILRMIIAKAEVILPGLTGSVLLIDESGDHLTNIIAPGLPDFYNVAIEGIKVGPGIGACGEAAYSGKRVVIENIATHPNWISFREIAQKAGLGACWSEPIIASNGSVLGTFAMYYRSARSPDVREQSLMSEWANMAAIAIEQKSVFRAMNEAREEAERANKAKSEFLSRMSHELRTPMNAILGFGQLLELEDLDDEQLNYVEEIGNAGKHLLELIDDVLDLSRIEVGQMNLSFEAVCLNEVVEECVSLVSPLAAKFDIHVIVDEKGLQNMIVRADHTRLRQSILNLLSNAIKYNVPGGRVQVFCKQNPDSTICLKVQDTGQGIHEEKQQQLFTAFNRLGAEQTEVEGTGIGLIITKNIIEIMGGQLEVESVYGKGSTFSMTLNQELPPIQKKAENVLEVESKPVKKLANNKFKILYIEDNPSNLRLVSLLMERRPDIELTTAHTPELGIDLLSSNPYDLVLLDINLPRMSGFDVLKRIRNNEDTTDLPVIAVSANAMNADIEAGKAAGFKEYITKPINVENFYRVIDQELANIETMME